MLLAAPDLVLALDVDKILAGDARMLERLYIVGDVHHSEHVVGVVDKPSETLARPCGQAIVVDEDVVAHTHLGDGNCRCQNRRISGRVSRTMRLRRMVT